jgi:hypothetical protein
MADIKLTQLAAAASLAGTEVLELSQLSTSVTITATTLSAQASDNSYNDSGSGFVAAGFAVGDQIKVTGFTGNAANNIFSATITALTTAKMTIGGTDGDVIVDDAAGESVTITKWLSVRSALPSGSSQGRHAVFVAAGSMAPSVTGGCAALARSATSANRPDMAYLSHDATTQEYHQFFFVAPKSWNQGTISAAPVYRHGATTTNFGVVWDLQAVATRNDDTIDVAFGTAQTSTDTGGTTSDFYMGPETAAITVAGTLGNEVGIWFRGSRVTGDGGDTMAIDADLLGWVLYFTTNADTDA